MQWSDGSHAMVIQWLCNGHTMVIQLSYSCFIVILLDHCSTKNLKNCNSGMHRDRLCNSVTL